MTLIRKSRQQARRAIRAAKAAITATRPGSGTPPPPPLARYRNDPVGYARDVLGVTPTPDQSRVAESLLQPPHRTLVKSGHNIGKSFLGAWVLNWWYDTRDPSVAISTAPTRKSVEDIVWAQIRLQRLAAGLPDHFIGPSAPEMRTHPDHYAKGFTASTGEAFQGRHRPNQLFLFDEAEDVDAIFWRVANTMFQPDGTNAWLALLNPTTTTSQSYQEERAISIDGNRKWRVFSLSSLDHPNIAAQLAGLPPPIPTAVTLDQVADWLGEWFEPIPAGDANPETDIEFPPGSGHWHRPGPEGESRVLGRRPSAGTYGVWSERLWQMATAGVPLVPSVHDVPQIGADIARFGDDRTEFHVRCGPCSYLHEDHSGWDTVRTADRLGQLADEWLAWQNNRRDPNEEPLTRKAIKIKVDDTGVGGGVTDMLDANGYNAIPVNAGEKADDADRYPRIRDELWFLVAALARTGRLDLTRIPKKSLARLEVQALAPVWRPTTDRRRSVESKEDTKKRLGRSPDGFDALNLAYYEASSGLPSAHWIPKPDDNRERNWRTRRGR